MSSPWVQSVAFAIDPNRIDRFLSLESRVAAEAHPETVAEASTGEARAAGAEATYDAAMHPVDRFRASFSAFDPATAFPVSEVYAVDVTFDDPAHHIEGRKALAAYFDRLNRNVRAVRFTFHDELRGEGRAALCWTMTLELRVGPRGPIEILGTSWLDHDERFVTRQRDHFDLGALVYERVPLLGTLVRAIRRRM